MKFWPVLIFVSIFVFGVVGCIVVLDLTDKEIAAQSELCARHGETLIPPTRYSDPNVVRCANDEGIVVSRKRY